MDQREKRQVHYQSISTVVFPQPTDPQTRPSPFPPPPPPSFPFPHPLFPLKTLPGNCTHSLFFNLFPSFIFYFSSSQSQPLLGFFQKWLFQKFKLIFYNFGI